MVSQELQQWSREQIPMIRMVVPQWKMEISFLYNVKDETKQQDII
jgi:hypothetical protein